MSTSTTSDPTRGEAFVTERKLEGRWTIKWYSVSHFYTAELKKFKPPADLLAALDPESGQKLIVTWSLLKREGGQGTEHNPFVVKSGYVRLRDGSVRPPFILTILHCNHIQSLTKHCSSW